MKELEPIKDSILEAYESIKTLSNDELRAKTQEFRQLIHDTIKEEEDRITEIRTHLENNYDMDVSEKEDLYKELEHLEKKAYDKTQKVLDQILPEAFSVMK